MRRFSKIRFIGYPIPTTPSQAIRVASGGVAGVYLGNPDIQTDIENRINIMKNAVTHARAQLPSDDCDVMNLFVAPEFFFHGDQGPYIYSRPEDNPVILLQNRLAECFPANEYPHWTFIFGTAVTSQVQNIDFVYQSPDVHTRNNIVKSLVENLNTSYGPLQREIQSMLKNFVNTCHTYPSVEVRNRALIHSNSTLNLPGTILKTDMMTTEKYYSSCIDFLLYEINGKSVITEQMTNYPVLDLSGGDAKLEPMDPYAIYSQNTLDFGIEICLDHFDTRLRRNIENQHPSVKGLAVQVIPSCGIQISGPSVAAKAGGYVFNCDGNYALTPDHPGNMSATSGSPTQGGINGVDSWFVNYQDAEYPKYAGHTQLARVDQPATGGDPNGANSTNATYQKFDCEVQVVDVEPTDNLCDYFAGGPGQIHIYGPCEL